MSPVAFLGVFFVCAAVLALWVDMRLGDRSPHTLKAVIVHAGCSILALQVVKSMSAAFISPDAMTVTMLTLFFIVLPGLMYVFLASFWFLKLVRAAMPR